MSHTSSASSLKEAAALAWRLVLMTRAEWPAMSVAVILGFLAGAASLVVPLLYKVFLDRVLPASNVGLLDLLCAVTAAVTVSTAIAGVLKMYWTQMVSVRLNAAVSLRFFDHVLRLPTRFFDRHQVGDIMSRLQDLRISLGFVSQVGEVALGRTLYLVVVPVILFTLNAKLTIIALMPFPASLAISALIGPQVRRHLARTAESYADLAARQFELLTNIHIVKAIDVESVVLARLQEQANVGVAAQRISGRASATLGGLNGALHAIGMAAVTWLGWLLIVKHRLTLGGFVAFVGYMGYLSGPVAQVSALFANLQQVAVSLVRLFEYWDLPLEGERRAGLGGFRGHRARVGGPVRVDAVSFAYDHRSPVLRELDLVARPGRPTALVGPSGAGKSTLIRLLCGMEDPDSGAIFFNDVPLFSLSPSDIRGCLSVVWQNGGLFRGTIWDNLTLGEPAARRSAVAQAVDICHLTQFIGALPHGYESLVAEGGVNLSAGQRQRIAVARALIRDRPIFLMDEGLSNVDTDTERDLLAGVLHHCTDRTVLFATHRPEAAALAAQVCLIADGRAHTAPAARRTRHLAGTGQTLG